MSIKSAIYAANTAQGVAIADGGVYVPTTIVRKYGPCVDLAGDGILLKEAGYYDVNATVTVAASAAGTVTATLYQNGVPVTGAVATATKGAAGDLTTLPISAIVRNRCNCLESVLTVVVSGQATTSYNLAITAEKI